jgi:hypothetical protein
MIKTFYNVFFTILLSCPSSLYFDVHFIFHNLMYLETYYGLIARICIWLRTCDCLLKVGLHFTGILGEKIDGLIVAYTRSVIQLPMLSATYAIKCKFMFNNSCLFTFVSFVCLVSYICHIVSLYPFEPACFLLLVQG